MEKILNTLCDRYISILKENDFGTDTHSSEHLIKMCLYIKENANKWPIDKSNRWLGYVQGVMTVYDLLNVDEERNFSRPLFHKYYEENGFKNVPSVDVKKSNFKG